MAYSADSFVADEQPTTAKWNKLWTNDASFNDGTGIGDNTILERHIPAGEISSEKLEATIAAKAYRTSSGNMSSEATVPLNSESFDLGGDWDTGNSRFVCPVSGYYLITGQVGTNNIGDGQQFLLRCYVDGVVKALVTANGSAAGNDPRFGFTTIEFADAGDFIHMTGEGSTTVSVSGGESQTFMAVMFIGEAA